MPADEFVYPEKPKPGDPVAVLSPSGRSASRFERVFDFGLKRLREEFDLQPVEYPTTRAPNATPEERAADIHAAFGDAAIKAVIASIGGDDEIKVLKYLDGELIRANPKPFFGYSDNTNLHLFLWQQRIVSYHGGAVMVQLARPGEIHPYTKQALQRALFTRDTYELVAATEFTDEERDWSEFSDDWPAPEMTQAKALRWHGPETAVAGPGWGGSLEIIDFNLRANRYIDGADAYGGAVLFLETSEELPNAEYVYRVLVGMGERGLLSQFAAVMVARAKAWSHQHPNDSACKEQFTSDQQEAVLRAIDEYSPHVPVVFGLDFGHTDPQTVLPSGGLIEVDSRAKRIKVTY